MKELEEQPFIKPLDIIELRAFLGLLYLSGVTVDNWFMSLELCDQLEAKKLTVLGT
ncbi:uncharacterized protein LOC124787996, partial [Schistocerca piceifrons]|uniref:uncharacterized protein LOC124787996 n=1 Tax=Schistocerca piceifrons TaxID=274613 RepID=UPI001F5F314E